eukprot:m.71138 g.71138  ORF g.71138 m.71138 type:complete len:305 (-) comp16078_c0_seq3:615-1529(-)
MFQPYVPKSPNLQKAYKHAKHSPTPTTPTPKFESSKSQKEYTSGATSTDSTLPRIPLRTLNHGRSNVPHPSESTPSNQKSDKLLGADTLAQAIHFPQAPTILLHKKMSPPGSAVRNELGSPKIPMTSTAHESAAVSEKVQVSLTAPAQEPQIPSSFSSGAAAPSSNNETDRTLKTQSVTCSPAGVLQDTLKNIGRDTIDTDSYSGQKQCTEIHTTTTIDNSVDALTTTISTSLPSMEHLETMVHELESGVQRLKDESEELFQYKVQTSCLAADIVAALYEHKITEANMVANATFSRPQEEIVRK